MRDLRLPMRELDFEQLAQLGRSLIPTMAPEWTDHNAHDPGIMLTELMAWIADAQIYALSRMRRDERLAYARLLGIAPTGPAPARGHVWPTVRRAASGAPALSWAPGTIVPRGTAVVAEDTTVPAFVTAYEIELSAATLAGLHTTFADGSTHDWTTVNAEEGATFMPFGEAPAPGDRLTLRFEQALPAGVPAGASAGASAGESVGAPASGAGAAATTVMSIGIDMAMTPEARTETPIAERASASRRARRLQASIEDSQGERPVAIAVDTTNGFLTSGVLLLRLGPGTRSVDPAFTISLRSASGAFMRPPRVQQIAPHVLPVEQVESIREVQPFGNGLPDQTYALARQGVMSPIERIQTHEQGRSFEWVIVEDLATCGPDDRAFALDAETNTLRFGNGINGLVPPVGAVVQIDYQVSEGARGNLPEGLRWKLRGIAGEFGTNREAMIGGRDAQGLDALRAVARREARTARPIVTTSDLELAARAFVDLGVTRAIELPPSAGDRRVRTRVLVVVGPHATVAVEGETESREFLDEIRARLAPRLPLGQRLDVVAPRYVTVRITARLVARPNVDPDSVATTVVDALRTRLAIVAARAGGSEWPFGRDLTTLAVKGWLRKLEGVASVVEVTLSGDRSPDAQGTIHLEPVELPRLILGRPDVIVERSPQGARR